jgi:hypothetical protein
LTLAGVVGKQPSDVGEAIEKLVAFAMEATRGQRELWVFPGFLDCTPTEQGVMRALAKKEAEVRCLGEDGRAPCSLGTGARPPFFCLSSCSARSVCHWGRGR